MANAITIFRMAASIVLLFCPVFSPAFFVFYIMAGLSDMLDGFVARKTNTVSRFGARLDTIADYVFVIVSLIKLLPVMRIPIWMYCFESKEQYLELGRGMVLLKNDRIVSGASSYTRYKEGIEIEVDTVSEERRKGLATI